MEENKKKHFLIPEQDVIRETHNLTARSVERDVYHVEHGEKLIGNLQNVEQLHRARRGPLTEEILVFKVAMAPKVHLHNKSTRDFLENSGVKIHAVKNDSTAYVSSSTDKWNQLRSRLEGYKNRNSYKDFQTVDNFYSVEHSEKEAESLRKILINQDGKELEKLDIQIMLLPNLNQTQKAKVIDYIINQIEEESGSVEEEIFYLSDGTPVIRAIVPSAVIPILSVEETVYKIMQTEFFSQGMEKSGEIGIEDCNINQEIDIDDLPIVTILDTGVKFVGEMRNFLADQWMAPGVRDNSNKCHGTMVAARAMFGSELADQMKTRILSPKVKIIDAQISDGTPMSPKQFIDRIEAAVIRFEDISKIFNLSFNADRPIEGEDISFIGAELDAISIKYNVQFVISSGNHDLYFIHNNLSDILDDSDSRISSPADSVLGLVVGSVMTEQVENSISGQGDISPFSRIGPGFAGTIKPDFVAPGGSCYGEINLGQPRTIPYDSKCATVLTPDGKLGLDVGTSFSSPIVSGEIAQILKNFSEMDNSLLISKALLIHTTESLWDLEALSEDEIEEISKYQGNGQTNLERAIYSTNSSVSFIRTGTLDRVNKEKIKFYIPEVIANQRGRNTARVTVTVVTQPDVDRTKGTEYCKSYVRASLKKVDGTGRLLSGNPNIKIGREKYQSYQHFSKLFSRFEPGDWQIWLQPFARWDTPNDAPIPYALVVTLEDTSGQLDLYGSIQNETGARYLSEIESRVRI